MLYLRRFLSHEVGPHAIRLVAVDVQEYQVLDANIRSAGGSGWAITNLLSTYLTVGDVVELRRQPLEEPWYARLEEPYGCSGGWMIMAAVSAYPLQPSKSPGVYVFIALPRAWGYLIPDFYADFDDQKVRLRDGVDVPVNMITPFYPAPVVYDENVHLQPNLAAWLTTAPGGAPLAQDDSGDEGDEGFDEDEDAWGSVGQASEEDGTFEGFMVLATVLKE